MNDATDDAPTSRLSAMAQSRPVHIDEMSDVRHLHSLSVRRLAAGHLAEEEVAAFAEHVYSEAYTGRLTEIALAQRLVGLTLSEQLIGTAGWLPAADDGVVARLTAVFVSPLYAGHGFGRRLVETVEADAWQAGFKTFTIRSPIGAAGFFAHLGYDIASWGVWSMTKEIGLPVAFMRKTRT